MGSALILLIVVAAATPRSAEAEKAYANGAVLASLLAGLAFVSPQGWGKLLTLLAGLSSFSLSAATGFDPNLFGLGTLFAAGLLLAALALGVRQRMSVKSRRASSRRTQGPPAAL
jgi:hypothetical protein